MSADDAVNSGPRDANRAEAETHFHRGNGLRAEGRTDEAIGEFRAALELDPEMAEAELNLGIVLEQIGRMEDALTSCTRAAAKMAQRTEAHLSLGNVLFKLHRLGEAIVAFRRAAACAPESFAAWLNLGNAQRLANELAAAEQSYERAAALRPDSADAFVNLANVYRAQNRLVDARTSAARALALDPARPEAHLNYAMTLLVAGDLLEAWPHAEFRHALKLGGAGRELPGVSWDGGAPLAGRRILLHGEQGFGDSIQFLRYVPNVLEMGAEVILEVQPALRDLVAASFPKVGTTLAHGENLPDFHFRCSLPSLPRAFRTELTTIPQAVPYLRAPPERVRRWSGIVGTGADLKVGIAWAGNPTHPNDTNRSLSLATLLDALDGVPGIRVFSLKKELTASDAALLEREPSIANTGAKLRDFADTAALIEQMDLVIAVDTSVAHLAGALGCPVWILLPFSPDWRWLLKREDSPWYPTARLFRQTRTGDWAEPLMTVRTALIETRAAKSDPGRVL